MTKAAPRQLATETAPPIDPFSAAIRAVVASEINRLRDELAEVVAARPVKRLLDTNELGQLLATTPATVRRLIGEGLPFIALGAVRRYDSEAVVSWLSAREQSK